MHTQHRYHPKSQGISVFKEKKFLPSITPNQERCRIPIIGKKIKKVKKYVKADRETVEKEDSEKILITSFDFRKETARKTGGITVWNHDWTPPVSHYGMDRNFKSNM